MKYKVKIITGFREDQHYTIDAEEAHKAYYLFLNPEARTVFSNGVALIGKNIQGIEPDFHATMGWNKGYELNTYDYEEISKLGVDVGIRNLLHEAKEIAQRGNPTEMSLPMPMLENK